MLLFIVHVFQVVNNSRLRAGLQNDISEISLV